MHQKSIRNVSQIQPSLPDLSHSNTIKIKTSIHISSYITYIYPKFIPNSAFSPYISHTQILEKSQIHPKCIRNVSEIYPKFNLLSLDLSHSNTIKIKTSIHISSYITYIYPKFIPNSAFSPYISQKYCKNPKYIPNASEIYQKCVPNSTFSPQISVTQIL